MFTQPYKKWKDLCMAILCWDLTNICFLKENETICHVNRFKKKLESQCSVNNWSCMSQGQWINKLLWKRSVSVKGISLRQLLRIVSTKTFLPTVCQCQYITTDITEQRGQISAQIGSYLPQMGQIGDVFKSDFSTFWLAEPKVTETDL